jgi:hypothetical protein
MKTIRKKKNPSGSANVILTPLTSKLFKRLSSKTEKEQNHYSKILLDAMDFDDMIDENIHSFDHLKKKANRQYKNGTLIDLDSL